MKKSWHSPSLWRHLATLLWQIIFSHHFAQKGSHNWQNHMTRSNFLIGQTTTSRCRSCCTNTMSTNCPWLPIATTEYAPSLRPVYDAYVTFKMQNHSHGSSYITTTTQDKTSFLVSSCRELSCWCGISLRILKVEHVHPIQDLYWFCNMCEVKDSYVVSSNIIVCFTVVRNVEQEIIGYL